MMIGRRVACIGRQSRLAVAPAISAFRTSMGAGRVIVIASMAVVMMTQAGLAASAPDTQPVLDPATGSYFVVKEMPGGSGSWSGADKFARSQSYQGRRGRLAVIRSKHTQDFLRANVKLPQATWIGLRYDCETRTSIWVDGHVISAKDFTYWHPQWVGDPTITCFNQNFYRDTNYMPVYLISAKKETPFLWQAIGPGKLYEGVLIEFPRPPAAK